MKFADIWQAVMHARTTTSAEGEHIKRGEETETYLANVDVGAVRADLGVVQEQHGRVDTSGGSDGVAGLVGADDVRGSAVLARVPETDGLVGCQVRAVGVDDAVVNNGKLVSVICKERVVVSICEQEERCGIHDGGDGEQRRERGGTSKHDIGKVESGRLLFV